MRIGVRPRGTKSGIFLVTLERQQSNDARNVYYDQNRCLVGISLADTELLDATVGFTDSIVFLGSEAGL